MQALLFAALAALMAVHLVVRAFVVPITHEEALRFFAWVQPAVQPIDHPLSGWWAMVSTALVGPALFPQRVLSLLAFVLFAGYAFRLGGLVQDVLLRWCLWIALLLMPFAVEMFALAGGQSLAMAFTFMALWHLGRIPHEPGSRHVLRAALAFVAVAFSATAMQPLWLVGELAVLVVVLRSGAADRWTRLGTWALVAVLSGLLLHMGFDAKGTDAEWYVAEKLRTWMDLVFATHAQWLVWSLVLSLGCMAWLGLVGGPYSGGGPRTVLLSTLALLVGWPSLYFAFQAPTDLVHDALPWLPLFLLGWGLALDRAIVAGAHRRWLALLLLLPALHMVLGIHVGTTRSSGDGAIPPKFEAEVLLRQQQAGRGLVVGGGVRQMPSWEYGRLFDQEPLTTLQTDHIALEEADLLLVSRWQADDASTRFHTVLEGPGGLTLMVRNAAHSTTTVLDTSISFATSDAEYRELPLPATATLTGRALSFDLSGVLLLDRRPAEGPFLVVEVNNADMGHAYYGSRSIGQYPRGRQGLPLRITHVLPPIPVEAQRVAIYIWNPARVPLSLQKARLHILQRNAPETQAKE
jgi:hypothetical protein